MKIRKNTKQEYDDNGVVKRRDTYGLIAIIFSITIMILVVILNIIIFSNL
ncbi:MAG: hypothetical protein K6A23_15230 [Butyrivibrio sp.]|nr:hypothetical protein [Butyrivibrio sp.]